MLKMVYFFKEYFKKNKFKIVFLLLLSILLSVLSLLQPFLNSKFIDFVLINKKKEIILPFLSLIFVMAIINLLFNYIYTVMSVKFKKECSFDAELNVLKQIQNINYDDVLSFDPVYLHKRISEDCVQLSDFVIDNTYGMVINAVKIVTILYLLIRFNPSIIIAVGVFIPVYIIVYITMRKPIYELGKINLERTNNFFSLVNRAYVMFREIRIKLSFNIIENNILENFRVVLNQFINYLKKVLLFKYVEETITALFQGVILIIGAYSVLSDVMTIGEFTLLNLYFSMILDGIRYFFEVAKVYQLSLVAYNRINELFIAEKVKVGENTIKNVQNIELKEVNYQLNEKKLIKRNISFSFSKGKLYLVIGQNGCGKTSLLNIISGLLSKNKLGNIKYNGIDIEEINTNSLRKNNLSIMLNNEVFDNLSVIEYLNIYGYELFNYIPEGLKNIFENENFSFLSLYEKNINELSQGEKQMLSIYCCLSKNKDVYILDEPTSNLSVFLQEKLLLYLRSLKERGKIIIVITHGNEFNSLADEILYI